MDNAGCHPEELQHKSTTASEVTKSLTILHTVGLGGLLKLGSKLPQSKSVFGWQVSSLRESSSCSTFEIV